MSEVAARQIVVDSDGISAQVQQMADRHDFDLIVVSVGRGEGASKRTVGKTLERVFDRADCPVLVIGPGIDRGVPLKTEPATILHATDFSPHAFAATQHAFSWAQEHQSWITLLHVVEGVRGATESERMRLQRPFREWMQELVPAELPIWCEVENRVAFGRPGEQIVQAAGELHADLIILGLNGMGTARQYSPGTTAREVIANASCPVLVVRDSMQQQEPVAAARRGGMRFAAMAA